MDWCVSLFSVNKAMIFLKTKALSVIDFLRRIERYINIRSAELINQQLNLLSYGLISVSSIKACCVRSQGFSSSRQQSAMRDYRAVPPAALSFLLLKKYLHSQSLPIISLVFSLCSQLWYDFSEQTIPRPYFICLQQSKRGEKKSYKDIKNEEITVV